MQYCGHRIVEKTEISEIYPVVNCSEHNEILKSFARETMNMFRNFSIVSLPIIKNIISIESKIQEKYFGYSTENQRAG